MLTLEDLLPKSIASLKTEAEIKIVGPWFMKSLGVEGEVCEFGCYKGTMSIKFACALNALGQNRKVYAFDTFCGFEFDDPDGGDTREFQYAANDDAFDELIRWSRVIPVKPIRGDARHTVNYLPMIGLSFVWLDLDYACLLDPVLRSLGARLHKNTIIGVDDVGRPETPGVEPWIDGVVASGQLREIERYDDAFIRFYNIGREVGV